MDISTDMKFSVVIPTYNRTDDLKNCLNSILTQSVLPTEVIIIDDAELSESLMTEWQKIFADKQINFQYYRKDHSRERRGLSESKNVGLNKASEEIVFFLDDDVVLASDFFQNIMKVWETN
jgi:glycosyltransferase involved in cell wall biosynthesis